MRGAKTRSVIIADDNAGLRNALKLALETEGYRARVAIHGADALAMQRNDPADALITDIFMPESDGFEAIDGFRREFPGAKIVVMSGDAKKTKGEYLKSAALIGVDATLKKPFQVETLLHILRSLGL